jgi:hypothetical protein
MTTKLGDTGATRPGPLMPKGGKLISVSVDPAVRKAWVRPDLLAALTLTPIAVVLLIVASLPNYDPLAPFALVSALVGGPVFAALYTWLEGLFGRRVATAWAILTAATEPTRARWRDDIGGRYPRTVTEAERWLTSHPPSTRTDWARASVLMRMGRVAEASDVISRLPSETELDQLDRTDAMIDLAVIEGRPVDLTPLADIAAKGGSVGAEAHTLLTLFSAKTAADAGADWIAIVLADRPLLGDQVDRNLRARFFKATPNRAWQFALVIFVGNVFVAGQTRLGL